MKNTECWKIKWFWFKAELIFKCYSLLQFYSSMTSEVHFFLILQNYIYQPPMYLDLGKHQPPMSPGKIYVISYFQSGPRGTPLILSGGTPLILSGGTRGSNQSVLLPNKFLCRRLRREPALGLIHISSWSRNSPQNLIRFGRTQIPRKATKKAPVV